MLEFLLLAYVFGPVAAIPYGLNNLKLDPLTVYVYLSVAYIILLPFIFWFLEKEGHYRKYYSGSISKKFSSITHKSVKDVLSFGDDIQDEFEKRMGHLGFYLAISVFTFLFGIFWASLFAYLLRVKKSRAIAFIAVGVLLGDAFWLFVTLDMWSMKTPIEVALMLLVVSLVIYGREREMQVIRWIASKTGFRKEAA